MNRRLKGKVTNEYGDFSRVFQEHNDYNMNLSDSNLFEERLNDSNQKQSEQNFFNQNNQNLNEEFDKHDIKNYQNESCFRERDVRKHMRLVDIRDTHYSNPRNKSYSINSGLKNIGQKLETSSKKSGNHIAIKSIENNRSIKNHDSIEKRSTRK